MIVLQVLFVCYADSTIYAHFVDENTDITVLALIKSAVHSGITTQSYRKRAQIYLDLHDKSQGSLFRMQDLPNEKHKEINCVSTAFVLIDNLLAGYPSAKSTRSCEICTFIFKKNYVSVNISLPTQTIQFLQDCVNTRLSVLQDTTCPQCKKTSFNEELELGKHLFLELNGF